jgi:hypothetical protein
MFLRTIADAISQSLQNSTQSLLSLSDTQIKQNKAHILSDSGFYFNLMDYTFLFLI